MMRSHGTHWGLFILIGGVSVLGVACSDSERSSAPLPGASPSTTAPVPGATGGSDDPGTTGGIDVGSDEEVVAASPTEAAAGGGGESVNPDLGLAPTEVAEDGTGAAPASATADAGASELPPITEEPTPEVPAPEEPTPVGPVTVYLAGDSIVMTYADTASDRDQAGWGQMLGGYFDESVTINNRAIGGRTARRYIDEGRLDDVSAELEPGDYLLVQFGTNDGNRTATYTIGNQTVPYFLDPATDFKAYLQLYIDEARGRGAIPVLVTPTPRNSAYCTGGNGTAAHAAAMKELGLAQAVTVVDLNASAVEYLRAICPAPNPENFFLLRADGTVDGTHFQENGARILAGFVADGLSVPPLPFAALRRD